MASTNVDALADKFMETQGLEPAAALAVAEKVLNADEDIAQAARFWLADGGMVANPKVEGYTPESLARQYSPSQVFTILIALRREPVRAQQMLKRFHG